MFKLSKAAANAIRWLVKNLSKLELLVMQIDKIRGSGAAQVKVTNQGITIHVDPPPPPVDGSGGAGAWYRVASSTVVSANVRWNYKLIAQKDGSATQSDGMQDHGTTERDGVNSYEAQRITEAGYENTSVNGLYKIPNNALVFAFWRNVNGTLKLQFNERNEPKCG